MKMTIWVMTLIAIITKPISSHNYVKSKGQEHVPVVFHSP